MILSSKRTVTPLAGVWIEISITEQKPLHQKSLPLRECGLKFKKNIQLLLRTKVTPLAGVWIEIMFSSFETSQVKVTPLAGVWIEIPLKKNG